MLNVKNIAISGYYLRGSSSEQTIFGRNVAAKELLSNIIKYTTAEELTFCYLKDYYQEHMFNRLCKNILKRNPIKTKISLIDRMELIQKDMKLENDIICDCVENFQEAVFLRDFHCSKHPPISITIHCASQVDNIPNFLIPSLFIGLKTYDAFFCSSVAVKKVIEKQLEHLCSSFELLHGIKIEPNFRLDVVPLGIDNDDFKPADKNESRVLLNIAKNEFVILYMGRVSTFFKGDLLPLIRVVKNLCEKNKNKNVRLVIAGANDNNISEYKQIRRFISALGIEKNVTIFESFDYEKRNLFYSAADVFASPTDSIQETFGLTPLEAMACGLPQISADWNGYKETIIDGETGYKVPTYWCECDEDISKYPNAFTEEFNSDRFYSHHLLGQSVAIDLNAYEYYLQKLLDNNALRLAMSKNSLQNFKNKYTLIQTIKAYENKWDELVDIKNSMTVNKNKKSSLYNLRYFNAFSHYPTYILNDFSKFKITELGCEFLKDDSITPWHYQHEYAFNEIKISRNVLVNFLEKGDFTVEEVIRTIESSFNKSVIKRSIMWLLKHGFIEHIKSEA